MDGLGIQQQQCNISRLSYIWIYLISSEEKLKDMYGLTFTSIQVWKKIWSAAWILTLSFSPILTPVQCWGLSLQHQVRRRNTTWSDHAHIWGHTHSLTQLEAIWSLQITKCAHQLSQPFHKYDQLCISSDIIYQLGCISSFNVMITSYMYKVTFKVRELV